MLPRAKPRETGGNWLLNEGKLRPLEFVSYLYLYLKMPDTDIIIEDRQDLHKHLWKCYVRGSLWERWKYLLDDQSHTKRGNLSRRLLGHWPIHRHTKNIGHQKLSCIQGHTSNAQARQPLIVGKSGWSIMRPSSMSWIVWSREEFQALLYVMLSTPLFNW